MLPIHTAPQRSSYCLDVFNSPLKNVLSSCVLVFSTRSSAPSSRMVRRHHLQTRSGASRSVFVGRGPKEAAASASAQVASLNFRVNRIPPIGCRVREPARRERGQALHVSSNNVAGVDGDTPSAAGGCLQSDGYHRSELSLRHVR